MKGKNILIGLLIFIILGGTSGFLVYYFVFDGGSANTPCVDYPFTAFPADLERIRCITPLGNLNPPGHTFPTDHIYFNVDPLYSDGFEVYSPGNLTINKISKVLYDPPQSGITEDFTMDFDVCKHISGRFGHINNLSVDILAIIGEFGEEYGDSVSEWEIDGRHYTSYNKYVDLEVDAGYLLGRAGYMGGYDFWLKDTRVILEWVNTDISRGFQNTVCPLAYFTDTLKTALLDKLAGWCEPVDPPGYCGKIDFDVPNTGQGIWCREGWTGHEAEERGLALVYSNINASKGVISIGNAENPSWDRRTQRFNPTNNGFMNRNFSQVTNDGNVYYYFCEEFGSPGCYNKVIMIKMIGDQELLLQVVDNGTTLPSDPTSLFDESLAVHYYR